MSIYSINGLQKDAAYNVVGNDLSVAYNVDGGEEYRPGPYDPRLTFMHSINMSVFNPNKIISPQGMAIYEDYIAQYFTNDDSLRLIDMRDWSIAGAYALPEFLHGNGLMFGKTVQPSGFPILYGSQFGESASVESRLIAITDIGLSSYSLDGYYDIPSSAGYHPQFVADWDNDRAYTIGYAQPATGYGRMTIAEYDISDMTTIISSWTVPYMGIVQGSTFWNGYIVVIGDSYDYSEIRVTFIDVSTQIKTEYRFTKKQNHDMEFQGVDVDGDHLVISSWIYDADDSRTLKYWLYAMNLPEPWQHIGE